MEPSMPLRTVLLLALAVAADPAEARQLGASPDRIPALVSRLEQAGAEGDRSAIEGLGVETYVPGLAEFASLAAPVPTRFVVKERDRSELPDGTQRLLLEVFTQRGSEAQITTWR